MSNHNRIFRLLGDGSSFLVGCMDFKGNDRPNDEELKKRLSSEQYQVCKCSATEAPFSGKYWDCKSAGTYACVCCETPLFDAESKFDSGSGWPSFWTTVNSEAVAQKEDITHEMVRTEIVCKQCGSHLGHVFEDGPPPTGLRYCVNSASLNLVQP